MKIWLILLLLTFNISESQIPNGVIIVQYNSDWNKANEIKVKKIKDVDILKLYLSEHPNIFKKNKIKYLPTLVLYKNKQEVIRVESDLSLELPENVSEIMYDEIEKSDFKIDITKPEFMFQRLGNGHYHQYEKWNDLRKKIVLI